MARFEAQNTLYNSVQNPKAIQGLTMPQNRFDPFSSSPSSISTSHLTSQKVIEHARTVQDVPNSLQTAGMAQSTLPVSPNPQISSNLLWCADSGATSHMCSHRDWFEDYEPCALPIKVADGTIIHSAGIGSVSFTPILNGAPARRVVFHRV